MIAIEDLRVELDTDTALVRAIDALRLSIARGETFALVGESGCGKSMTALALMRLLPENGRVTAGRILVAGDDILDLPESRMRGVRGAAGRAMIADPVRPPQPIGSACKRRFACQARCRYNFEFAVGV